jgi:ABC-type Fe3+/spermidine/putrescine transport system ATPase subunit
LLEGRLAQHDTPEAFYARPATEAVARFFGGVNFIPGSARSGRFDYDLGPLDLPTGTTDGPALLTLRPEALRLGPGPNQRAARILSLGFLGSLTRVELSVSGVALQALMTPDSARTLTPGAEVPVSLPPEALWVLPSAGSAPTAG